MYENIIKKLNIKIKTINHAVINKTKIFITFIAQNNCFRSSNKSLPLLNCNTIRITHTRNISDILS